MVYTIAKKVPLGLCILALALSWATCIEAANPEYRCEQGTVDDDAVAVTYSDVDVGTFSNPDDKTCTFAIGGASSRQPTSPAAPESPIEQLVNQVRVGQVEELAFTITLARSTVEREIQGYRSQLIEVFSKYNEEIYNCFVALSVFKTPDEKKPIIEVRDDEYTYVLIETGALQVSCAVIARGSHSETRSVSPTLRIKIRGYGDGVDNWYLPKNALNLK